MTKRHRERKELRVSRSVRRSRTLLDQRLTEATRPQDTVWAAVSHLIAALKRASNEHAQRTADHITATLITAADELNTTTVATITALRREGTPLTTHATHAGARHTSHARTHTRSAR